MSLVNDALKRATEVQKNTASAPMHYLPLRPAEPAMHRKIGIGLILPAALLVVLLAALFLFWMMKQNNRSNSNATAVSHVAVAGPAAVAVVANPSTPPPVPAAAVSETPLPSPPPTVESAPPKLAPLKLQAVFYDPAHPSAIISGKTVYVGDSVRDFHVVAIGSASVMLVNGSQTNLLTIE